MLQTFKSSQTEIMLDGGRFLLKTHGSEVLVYDAISQLKYETIDLNFGQSMAIDDQVLSRICFKGSGIQPIGSQMPSEGCEYVQIKARQGCEHYAILMVQSKLKIYLLCPSITLDDVDFKALEASNNQSKAKEIAGKDIEAYEAQLELERQQFENRLVN